MWADPHRARAWGAAKGPTLTWQCPSWSADEIPLHPTEAPSHTPTPCPPASPPAFLQAADTSGHWDGPAQTIVSNTRSTSPQSPAWAFAIQEDGAWGSACRRRFPGKCESEKLVPCSLIGNNTGVQQGDSRPCRHSTHSPGGDRCQEDPPAVKGRGRAAVATWPWMDQRGVQGRDQSMPCGGRFHRCS